MKTLFGCVVLLAGMAPILALGASPTRTLTLDLAKSSVKWSGKFSNLPVKGEVKFKSGQFVLKKSAIVSGNLVADLNSLSTDSGMDEQIKGPLLLNVAQYPTVELKITEFDDVHAFVPGGPNAHINGTLKFRGKVHDVSADFVITPDKKGAFHVSGTFPTVYGKMVDGVVAYEVWTKK